MPRGQGTHKTTQVTLIKDWQGSPHLEAHGLNAAWILAGLGVTPCFFPLPSMLLLHSLLPSYAPHSLSVSAVPKNQMLPAFNFILNFFWIVWIFKKQRISLNINWTITCFHVICLSQLRFSHYKKKNQALPSLCIYTRGHFSLVRWEISFCNNQFWSLLFKTWKTEQTKNTMRSNDEGVKTNLKRTV